MDFKEQWNVKHNIQSRLKALYTELPMPLDVAIEEQAVNEFFACLILDKTGETVTVRKVYDLVGGDNNKVAARLKVLRPYLKERQSSDESAITALKKQIEKQVRARLELELIEQENDYLEQLASLKEESELKAAKLTQENAEITGQVRSMQSHMDDQKTLLATMSEREATLNKTLNQLTVKCEKLEFVEAALKEQQGELKLDLENQKLANKNLVGVYSERASVQQSVIEHGQMLQSKLVKEMAELNNLNQSLDKQLNASQAALMVEQKLHAEQALRVSEFDQQSDVTLLIKEALAQALSPAEGFDVLAQQLENMLKLGVNDTSVISRSINSLETQVLNASSDLEKIIESKFAELPVASIKDDKTSG